MCKKITQLIKIADEYPCFTFPIAEENGIFYMPLYDENTRITGFQVIDDIMDYSIRISIPEDKMLTVQPGYRALFGYAPSSDFEECILGKYEEFIEKLKAFVEVNPDTINLLPIGKQYELFRTINDEYLISKFFVTVIMGDTSPQIKRWAKNEVKKYKNCEFKQTDSDLVFLFGEDCSLIKGIIQRALNERVASIESFERLCLNKLNEHRSTDLSKLLSKNYANEIVGINKVLLSSESNIFSSLFSFRSLYTLPELLKEEGDVQKGRVLIQSIDLNKTELRSETLNEMEINMRDGTVYDYYFSEPCDDCEETVYKIKAQILSRNPEIDVNKQMRFWDISEWDEAQKYNKILKNIVFWECERGVKKAFVLLCGWKECQNSVFGETEDEGVAEFLALQEVLEAVRRPIAA
jgi:tetratricopeptide (TPR) repeat protein